MTKQFSNYSDLITFTRASGGHALRPVSYGDELVENGTFNTDVSGWTETDATTVSLSYDAGRLRVLSTAPYEGVYQDITTTVGRIYSFTRTVEGGTGTLRFRTYAGPASGGLVDLGGISAIDNGAGSTETFIFIATSTTTRIQMQSWNTFADFWLDNVSVKEVLFDQPDGTLTLFEHPDNVPRVEWDADRNRLGLLVEEQRINLITHSEDFSNAYWPKADVTVSASSEVDPSGGTNAYELVESATTANHLLNKTGVVGANTYSEFIFAKANTRSWIRLQSQSPSNSWINVNLSTGEKGLSGGGENSSSVEDFGNGWYKISLNFTATTTTGPQIFVLDSDRGGASPSYLGDGTSSILIYGAQLEVGSFPTSYIKSNSGSTTTRSADVASIPVADFGFNTGAGTFVAEFDFTDPENDDNNYVIGGTSSSRIFYNNVGNSLWQTYDGNAAVTFGNLDNTGTDRFKAAVGVKTGKDVATVLDGNVKGSSTSATALMTNLKGSDIAVGGGSDTQKLNGHIKSIQYYPRRLSNAQLVELTS